MASLGKMSSFLILVVVWFAVVNASAQSAAPAPGQATPTASPQDAQNAAQNKEISSQAKSTGYESATVLKATTRLVLVDVVATDKKGAVADLERSDFTVLEDGTEQQIRVFSFQHPTLGDHRPEAPRADLPDNVFTNIPSYPPTNALNVLLLDSINTTFQNQAYVRGQMLKYLEKMPEDQPMAVYLLNSNGRLTLLQDFTTDPAILRSVVKNFKSRASPLLDSAAGPELDIVPPGLNDPGTIGGQALQSMVAAMASFEQQHASFQADLRIKYTMVALTAISRTLSGYPGRKNLVWVSEAFPLTIDPNSELSGDAFAGMRNYSSEVAAAADALIDAQIAIYPVDARGLMPFTTFEASNSGRDRYGRALSGPRALNALRTESAQLRAAHDTMNDMAERTGGKAFYNRNDIDGAVRRSIEDGSTYYTLAYYPLNKDWNGKFRKIHVNVNRPGIKLRYRLGYYAVDPKVFVEKNKREQGSLLGEALSLNSPVSTALKFQAGVIQPSEKTQKKVLVNFALDPQAISFESRDDGMQHAVVECVVQAYSAKGKLIKTESSTVTASLKPDSFSRVMRAGFPCQQTIELPAGSYFLRLGVRDDRTGLMGTANARVKVDQASVAAPPAETSKEDKKP